MVPAAFVFLEALPLSPNGKVDRMALPPPDAIAGAAATHVGPRTPIEQFVAEIWAEVLRVPVVGVHDNFFEVGGHSLLATQIVSRLRKAVKIELPLRAFFEAPTVAGLAAAVRRLLLAGSDGADVLGETKGISNGSSSGPAELGVG